MLSQERLNQTTTDKMTEDQIYYSKEFVIRKDYADTYRKILGLEGKGLKKGVDSTNKHFPVSGVVLYKRNQEDPRKVDYFLSATKTKRKVELQILSKDEDLETKIEEVEGLLGINLN